MSEYGAYGASDEEFAPVRKHLAEVEANPDIFENWESLIKAAENLEGGLNRNSSPQALATVRDAYDRFLNRFPLLFGYWKKYADLEFSIASAESAEMVFERGVACCTHSVDLWTEYCNFKMETTHIPHLVRELFERGAKYVGLDFHASLFWDKYIEYEQRQEAPDRIFAILGRIIRIPLHAYNRYFEKFRQMSYHQPLANLAAPNTIAHFRAEVEGEAGPRSELEIERDVRAKIDQMFVGVTATTQTEVQRRWVYESKIERPYFHVTELHHPQLENWRQYLDFEEAEGDHDRIVCLYERCLTTCAFYDEFWFRYARWMAGQNQKHEELRIIYMRASTMFVPISRPGIRLQWAFFEESRGRLQIAADIHEAILLVLPDNIDVIVSLANTVRRQKGVDAAMEVYDLRIESPNVEKVTKAALVAEKAYLTWLSTRDATEARAIFQKNAQWYSDSVIFYQKWFKLEVEQQYSSSQEERLKEVFEALRAHSRLSAQVKRELATVYLDFLVRQGGPKAMKAFLEVDRDMFGPASVANVHKGNPDVSELDEATRRKAETPQLNYYDLHAATHPDAQGAADFH